MKTEDTKALGDRAISKPDPVGIWQIAIYIAGIFSISIHRETLDRRDHGTHGGGASHRRLSFAPYVYRITSSNKPT